MSKLQNFIRWTSYTIYKGRQVKKKKMGTAQNQTVVAVLHVF